MTRAFTVAYDGPVATVTLSNPEKRNALSAPFWEEFPDAIEEIDRSGETRCIVLGSEGPHFTAGLDLSAFGSVVSEVGAAAGLDFLNVVSRMQRAFNALEDARVPVIAAIQGGCIGGGVDMVTACDVRLCARDAYFTIYEVVIGMTADVGTFPRILNHLPEGVVRELAYTGRRMGAEEAHARGLVNAVHEDHAAVRAAAQEMAREIATRAPMAVHGCKRAITYARDHTTKEALDWVGLWNASMLKQSELMEAMRAKQTGEPGDFAKLPRLRKVAE
jgi:enoyl-CoA hydratase